MFNLQFPGQVHVGGEGLCGARGRAEAVEVRRADAAARHPAAAGRLGRGRRPRHSTGGRRGGRGGGDSRDARRRAAGHDAGDVLAGAEILQLIQGDKVGST